MHIIFCFAWSTFTSLGRAIMWLLHTCASHLIAIVNKDGQTSTTDEPRPFPISSMQVCKCISLRVYQHLIQHTRIHTNTHTHKEFKYKHQYITSNINTISLISMDSVYIALFTKHVQGIQHTCTSTWTFKEAIYM